MSAWVVWTAGVMAGALLGVATPPLLRRLFGVKVENDGRSRLPDPLVQMSTREMATRYTAEQLRDVAMAYSQPPELLMDAAELAEAWGRLQSMGAAAHTTTTTQDRRAP